MEAVTACGGPGTGAGGATAGRVLSAMQAAMGPAVATLKVEQVNYYLVKCRKSLGLAPSVSGNRPSIWTGPDGLHGKFVEAVTACGGPGPGAGCATPARILSVMGPAAAAAGLKLKVAQVSDYLQKYRSSLGAPSGRVWTPDRKRKFEEAVAACGGLGAGCAKPEPVWRAMGPEGEGLSVAQVDTFLKRARTALKKKKG